jgi:hypothetical protein
MVTIYNDEGKSTLLHPEAPLDVKIAKQYTKKSGKRFILLKIAEFARPILLRISGVVSEIHSVPNYPKLLKVAIQVDDDETIAAFFDSINNALPDIDVAAPVYVDDHGTATIYCKYFAEDADVRETDAETAGLLHQGVRYNFGVEIGKLSGDSSMHFQLQILQALRRDGSEQPTKRRRMNAFICRD